MSTNTTPQSAVEQPQEQPDEPIIEIDESADPTTLLCPRDGAILLDAQQPETGHYECPRCRSVWPIWEVLSDG